MRSYSRVCLIFFFFFFNIVIQMEEKEISFFSLLLPASLTAVANSGDRVK